MSPRPLRAPGSDDGRADSCTRDADVVPASPYGPAWLGVEAADDDDDCKYHFHGPVPSLSR